MTNPRFCATLLCNCQRRPHCDRYIRYMLSDLIWSSIRIYIPYRRIALQGTLLLYGPKQVHNRPGV